MTVSLLMRRRIFIVLNLLCDLLHLAAAFQKSRLQLAREPIHLVRRMSFPLVSVDLLPVFRDSLQHGLVPVSIPAYPEAQPFGVLPKHGQDDAEGDGDRVIHSYTP